MTGQAMRRFELAGAEIATEAQFYAALRRAVPDLPAGFGDNLDALWDALTRDIAGPFELVWTDASRSAETLGPAYPRLVDVLRRAAAERPDFTLRLGPAA